MIINDPATVAEVTAAFEAYERALMVNDLPMLDAFSWNSAHVVRYGTRENLYGAEEIAAFRRARVGGAPARDMTRVAICTFDQNFGTTCIEYVSATGGYVGRQMQSWALLPEGWRIVAAHVSNMTDSL